MTNNKVVGTILLLHYQQLTLHQAMNSSLNRANSILSILYCGWINALALATILM